MHVLTRKLSICYNSSIWLFVISILSATAHWQDLNLFNSVLFKAVLIILLISRAPSVLSLISCTLLFHMTHQTWKLSNRSTEMLGHNEGKGRPKDLIAWKAIESMRSWQPSLKSTGILSFQQCKDMIQEQGITAILIVWISSPYTVLCIAKKTNKKKKFAQIIKITKESMTQTVALLLTLLSYSILVVEVSIAVYFWYMLRRRKISIIVILKTARQCYS